MELANKPDSKTAGTEAQHKLDAIPIRVTTAFAAYSSIWLPHVFPAHVIFPTI
jgi:hypothetical protein